MVVFTCNNCGDSLQKPKVEKHYNFVCRREKSLTCVDCLKDFMGEDYIVHNKCLTEEERYSAKGTFKNGDIKKGELKQELWSDTIKSILVQDSSINKKCMNLLNHIVNFSNIPRKKQKFMNFIKSTMGGRVDNRTVEEVWNIIEEYKTKAFKSAVEEVKNQDLPKRKVEDLYNNQNGDESKKLKVELVPGEVHNGDATEEQLNVEGILKKFNFKDEILRILNKKESISIVKLEKKILKKYSTLEGDLDLDKFKRKFAKKLKKVPNSYIEDGRISIKI